MADTSKVQEDMLKKKLPPAPMLNEWAELYFEQVLVDSTKNFNARYLYESYAQKAMGQYRLNCILNSTVMAEKFYEITLD